MLERLRRAFWDANARDRLAKSVRIRARDTVSDDADHYRALLLSIDPHSLDDPILAGWWLGWADTVSPLMPENGAVVRLEPGTDLEWVTWRATWSQIARVMKETFFEPGLLASIEPGWVLFSPPSSNDMFLYPEVSASDH